MKIKEMTSVLNLLHCGKLTFTPFAVLKGGERVDASYTVTQDKPHRTVKIESEYKTLFKDTLYLNYTDDCIVAKRVFQNCSSATLSLCELGIDIGGITFGKAPRDDYFFHAENGRIYETLTFPLDYKRTAKDAKDSDFDFQAGNRWADPGVIVDRIGASPYQPFPAILISNYQETTGLVHGTLNQDVFYHCYLAGHRDGAAYLTAFSAFKDIAYLEMEPGRILNDEWYLGRTDAADDIEQVFAGYTAVLRQKFPCAYGRTNLNRNVLVWGSWNDGLFRNVSEDLILKEARFLRDHFPTVKWIQLDDGYATINNLGAHGLGVPYEKEAGIDHQKFPNGLRGYTDKIRELGLRPAVWIGGFCPTGTPIFKEHPEWFIDYSYRTEKTEPLDVSLPEVREYIEYAMKTLCRDYGFDAVKHDFWSYAFEDSHDLLRNKTQSGYELRRWWLTYIRKQLAKDGYLQTGCDLVEGNPFLGEFFTNYRYGIDIGNGHWDNVRATFVFGTACFATHTGDLFVPNSDSIGTYPGLNRTEALFCTTYSLVTHSMVEIAGKLSECTDEERLRILKKAACNPNNGQDVYYAQFNYRDHKQTAPEIMYFKTPHFSTVSGNTALPLVTVGFFNLADEQRTFTVTVSELGLDSRVYALTDVWTGAKTRTGGTIKVTLEPHACALLAISNPDGIQLLDANIRINDAVVSDNELTLYPDYATDAVELTFRTAPKAILCNGKEIPFTLIGDTVAKLDLAEASPLTVRF